MVIKLIIAAWTCMLLGWIGYFGDENLWLVTGLFASSVAFNVMAYHLAQKGRYRVER